MKPPWEITLSAQGEVTTLVILATHPPGVFDQAAKKVARSDCLPASNEKWQAVSSVVTEVFSWHKAIMHPLFLYFRLLVSRRQHCHIFTT